MKSYVVDTYAWISYLEGRKEFQEAIEENELYTPSIVLAEVSRILTRRRVPKEKATQSLEFMKQRSLVLSLDESNAAGAGETAEKEGLNLIDGIIYSYVGAETRLLTGDKHFRDKPYTDFVEPGPE